MTNETNEANLLAECMSYARAFNFHLVELPASVFDSFMRPIGAKQYRLVDASTGRILTHGTIETVRAYFSHAQTLGRILI